MNRDSDDERRERTRRAKYLKDVHGLREPVARCVVAAEQGWSSSGTAKLPDIDVTESTVKSRMDSVVEQFGPEAVFAKVESQRTGPLGPSEKLGRHMSYDPEELEKEAESADGDETFPAQILSIEETTAEEVYGDDARNPDRDMIECEVKAETESDHIVFTDTFTLPQGKASWNNPNFKLGNYREKYGELPTEGAHVQAGYNDDGFLRVVVEE